MKVIKESINKALIAGVFALLILMPFNTQGANWAAILSDRTPNSVTVDVVAPKESIVTIEYWQQPDIFRGEKELITSEIEKLVFDSENHKNIVIENLQANSLYTMEVTFEKETKTFNFKTLADNSGLDLELHSEYIDENTMLVTGIVKGLRKDTDEECTIYGKLYSPDGSKDKYLSFYKKTKINNVFTFKLTSKESIIGRELEVNISHEGKKVTKSGVLNKENVTDVKIVKDLLKPACYDDINDPNRWFKNAVHPRLADRPALIIHTMNYMPENDDNIERISDDIYSVEGAKQVLDYYEVSSHAIIDRNGGIHQLVDFDNIAYHAGLSAMPEPDGRKSVNPFSVGVELLNSERDNCTEAQYDSLAALTHHLNEKYGEFIVLGHEDIAVKAADIEFREQPGKLKMPNPFTKTDPWNFDWQKYRLKYYDIESQYYVK